MKCARVIFCAALLLGAGESFEVIRRSVAAAGPPPEIHFSERVVLRGWEIVSVAAIRRAAVVEVFPEYHDGRRVGNRRSSLGARRGEFLILQLGYKWATPVEPSDALWIGQPNVRLVSEDGAEYPCLGVLSREAGDFLTLSMVTAQKRSGPTRPNQMARALIYFDVPAGPGNYWLVFSDEVPAVGVDEVDELSVGDIDLPN